MSAPTTMPDRPTRRAPAGRPGGRRPRPARDAETTGFPLERPLAWLFPALLAGMVAILFADFLSLSRLYLFQDIGADTLTIFYPQRVLIADYLRRFGIPGWSFSQGMGQNVYPGSMGDPFAWILYLLGPRRLAYGIAWVEALKVLAAGGLFYALLRLQGLSRFVASLTALGYAFCATLIVGGGWWFILSNQVVHAALLLVACELLLQGRAPWLLPLAVALTAASHLFEAYQLGILLLAYAAARHVSSGRPSSYSFPVLLLRIAGLGLLGIAISAAASLPAALEMLQSPRVGGRSGLSHILLHAPVLGLGDARLYATEILRLFGSDLLGTGSGFRGWTNYLEAPMPYCGLLALLLAPQAWAASRGRARLVTGVLGGLLLLLCVFPWFRHAFWLFTGDYFRSLSLFLSIALLLSSAHALEALARRRALRLPLLGVTFVLLLALLNWPYSYRGSPATVDPQLRWVVTLFLALYAGLTAALARREFAGFARLGLLLAVPVELLLLSSPSVRQRPTLSAAEWESRTGYHDYTTDALDLIRRRDPGFFRVEKNYMSSPSPGGSLNDAKAQGYYGTTSYHSFNQLNYIRFLGGLGVIDPSDPVQTNWAPGLQTRPLLQTFASVRYWLYRGDYHEVPMLASTYEPIGTVGDLTILRNRHFIPLGFGLDRVARESALTGQDPARRDVTLLHAVVIPDSIVPSFPRFAEFAPESIPLPYTMARYEEDARRCADHAMAVTRMEPNHIAGRVSGAGTRIQVFSIPFDEGWSARVDGRRAPLRRIDFGLTGLEVPGGGHELSLDYEPPLRRAGLAISLLGALGTVGAAFLARRPRIAPPA